MTIKSFKPKSKYNIKLMLIWVGVFAAIGVAALILTHAAPTASMSLSPSTANVTVGSSVSVTVQITAGSNQITGAQACVSYDATKLSLVSTDVSASALKNAIPASSADCAAGQAQISRFDTSPATGTFTLGVLNFTVIQAGTTPIALNIDTAKSYVRDNATTDSDGNYANILTAPTGTTLTPPAPPPVTPPPAALTATMSLSPATGSVTNDSSISITVQVVAGTDHITGAQACITYDATKLTLTSTDVSTSPLKNAIPASSADCAAGQAQISRFDTSPATGTFTLGVLTFKAILPGSTVALNFDTAKSYIKDNVTTDSDGNYANILTGPTGSTLTIPPVVVTPPPPPSTPAPATMVLSPATGSVTNGSAVMLTVQVKAGTNHITGAQACITYDATKLTLTKTDASTSPLTNAIPASSADCAAGQAQISRFDTSPATGTFTLGVLTFTAIQGSTSAALNFDAAKSYIKDNATTDSNGNYTSILTGTTGSTLTLNGIPAPPPTPVTVTSSIANGQTISGNVTWTADTTGPDISKVEFYIDNILKWADSTTPYQFNGDPSGVLDTNSLTSGRHVLKLIAYATGGNVTDSVSATVQNGDITPPSAPTGLQATAAATNKVNLSWVASTDNVGVSGYWIVRNGATIAQVAPSTTFADTSVAAGTSYSYQVTAYDAAGNNSAASSAASVKTPSPVTPDKQAPSEPTELTATTISSTQINLNWQASTDNVRVTGYDVYRALGSAEAARVATVTTTSFGDSGLAPNSSYTYYVVARDSANNSSAHSKAATAKTAEVANTNGSLSGTISGPQGRTPWTLITINFNGFRHIYVTNSAGEYTISNLPANTYTVKYFAFRYDFKTVTVTIPAGTRVVQNITLVKRR